MSSPLPLYGLLHQIKNGDQFAPLREYLQDQRQALAGDLIKASDEKTIYRMQGAARWIGEFQSLIDQAQSLAAKEREREAARTHKP